MPDRLPIYDLEQDFVAGLQQQRRLIIQAPTGSGKSTQIPQILLEHGFLRNGQVIVLQPRRLAARLLASRVAQERSAELGREVGYQIRFEHVAGDDTKIKYVTEGILLRQMIQDPKLAGVQVVIFDEFHERHLYGDITLARALDLQETERPDLALIVMSATLEASSLQAYLQPCAVLSSAGRTFPVEVDYALKRPDPNSPPVWELAAEAFRAHVQSGGAGDVLVFMPGSYEIQQTLEAIRQTSESKGFLLLPLHGELPPRDQDAAVARYDQPKVVVSTNVAETSLTIEGIRLVIDSGLARIPRYDPNRGINTLLVEKISRASAEQRTGRAGRTAPGRCARLWSSQEHWERPEHELPEIKRLDLSEVVLTLKAAGIQDLRRFRWLEPPSEQALQHAEELLIDLGALKAVGQASSLPRHENSSESFEKPETSEGSGLSEPHRLPQPSTLNPPLSPNAPAAPPSAESPPVRTTLQITDLGRRMLAFPVHPRYSRMLLAAQEYGCVYQACLVAALTQGRDLLIRNPGREVGSFREDLFGDRASSDFWILMRAWSYAAKNNFRLEACRKAGVHALTARQVGPLLDQFLDIARREGLNIERASVPDEALQKCILIGFSDRVARRLDEGTLRCDLVHGRRGVLARESVVQHSPVLAAAEVSEVEGRDQSLSTLLSLATAIEIDWLRELFPEDIRTEPRTYYDSGAKRVYAEEQIRFRDLVLDTRRLEPPPADAAARILANEVLLGRLVLKHWDHSVDQWILRLELLSRWCPELQLTPIRDEDRRYLAEQICHDAISYKDIKEREVKSVVKSWLSSEQQELVEKHAPERLPLANGRTPKITYVPNGDPYVAVRLQELYGVRGLPRIGMTRVPVLVHILAPNMRPVQITQDLASFWKEHYPRIKQELQRKYPKHEWR
ncbi:MAG: ATP-dependent RNA helicase [Verrucomicrobia bacterium]|nr:ATP-dependent RNA helicase [Verrucomicrobiota bacterium]